MAKENVKKFFDEVSKKEDLQKQLSSASEKSNVEMAKVVKAQAEAVVAIAKASGFDFTVEELLAAGEGDKKLDVNELDAVSGGKLEFSGCFIIGVGWGGATYERGIGANACWVIGIGGGITIPTD